MLQVPSGPAWEHEELQACGVGIRIVDKNETKLKKRIIRGKKLDIRNVLRVTRRV